MVGRLAGVTLEMLRLPALLTVLASGAALALSYELDLLSLGDEVAQSVGLSTRLARSALLTLAAVLCGAAVSFAGLVGFVGLLVPTPPGSWWGPGTGICFCHPCCWGRCW